MGNALTVVQKRPVEVAVGITALVAVGVIVYETTRPKAVFRGSGGRSVSTTGAVGGNLARLQDAIVKASAQETFTATEALRLDAEFTKCARATEDGTLVIDLAGFMKVMTHVGITDQALATGLFRNWDTDGSGTLDFVEFMHSLALVLGGSPEDKLEQLWFVMDADGSNSIDAGELGTFYANMFRMAGQVRSPAEVQALVVRLFSTVNKHPSTDVLLYHEFVQMAKSSKFMAGESLQEFMAAISENFTRGLRGAALPRLDSTLPAPAPGATAVSLAGEWKEALAHVHMDAEGNVVVVEEEEEAAQEEGGVPPPPPAAGTGIPAPQGDNGGLLLARQSSRSE